MGSQTLDILRQGFWASLSGGWFFDPYQPVLTNTFHLYTWLCLLLWPFVIHLYFSEPNYIAWSIYWVFLLIFFALVKYINARLHRMFDTSEGITQIYHPENSPEEIRSSVDDSGSKRSRRARTSSQDDRRSSIDVSLSRIRRRPEEFFGGLNAEVTAIEMEDLSSGGRCHFHRDSSTKNTVASSAGNTPPVQRSSLTDLTKAGIAASTSSISAEAIRDRVAKSSSHQDVQVDIHQPKHLSSHHHNPDETDVGPLLDQTNTSSEAANTSATTTNNQVESVSNHRRFSNLSNLAQSLPSTSSSASALVAGSVDFLTSGCHGNQGRHGGRGHLRGRGSRDQRRNQRMMNMGGNDLESTPNQQTGDVSVRRTQSAFETETKTLLTSKLEAEEDEIPQDEISDEENIRGSQSPLLVKRHQSLEVRPSIERHHPTSVSSRSLDRHLEDRGCCSNNSDRKAVLGKNFVKSTSSLMSGRNTNLEVSNDEEKKIEAEAEASELSGGGCSDVEIALSNFQAEIDEATQALLKASQYVPPPAAEDSSISSSRQLSRKNSQRDNLSVLSGSQNSKQLLPDPCKSENQSLLGAIGPLDWLFSDSDEPEPPSSPKCVTKSKQTAAVTEQEGGGGSAATIAGNLENNSNVNRGAIPKRPRQLPKQSSLDLQQQLPLAGNEDSASDAVDVEPVTDLDETVEQHSRQNSGRWHRKALRRRPPTPPSTSTTSEMSSTAGPSDLRQRILEILTTNNNQDCDRELNRLKRELEANNDSTSTPEAANSTSSTRRTTTNQQHRRRRPQESEMTEEEAEMRRRRRAARRAERLRMASTVASPTASVTSNPISNILGTTPGTHIATDHEDTTEGAVHCFQDEFGNWHSYTFGLDSSGTASMVVPNVTTHFRQPPIATATTSTTSRRASRSSSCVSTSSGLTVILDNPTMVFQPKPERDLNDIEAGATASEAIPQVLPHQDSPQQPQQLQQQQPSQPQPLEYFPATSSVLRIRRRRSPLHQFAESLLERTRQATTQGGPVTVSLGVPGTNYVPTVTAVTSGSFPLHFERISEVNSSSIPSHHPQVKYTSIPMPPRTYKYYMFRLHKWLPKMKIKFDRLGLLALMDRNVTWIENFSSIFLALLVGVFSGLVLNQGYYADLTLFLFCAVTASCQYSLIKSVQPDSASPTHGFNRMTVFSRAIYFSLCCGLILILEEYGGQGDMNWIQDFKKGVYIFVLCFPAIFVFGLLPQVNTCAMYVLEQIDIHIFGGNAASSLLSSIYCLCRSFLAVGILIGFAYGGLTGEAHSKHTQEILFSLFCGLNVAISYHLSRSSSDPTIIFTLIKRQLMMPPSGSVENTSVDEACNSQENNTGGGAGTATKSPEKTRESPGSAATGGNGSSPQNADSSSNGTSMDPFPKKLRDTVHARLKSDGIMCIVIVVATTLLHWSGFFDKLQPNLNYVLWIMASIFGFGLHYVLPQLRKQLPWLCFSHPILKSREYGQFEVRKAAKVMWFEKAFMWLQFLEKAVVFPMVVLSALSMDMDSMRNQMNYRWYSAIILVVCGLKLFRSIFSDCSKQFMVLLLTLLYFQYGPETRQIHGLTSSSNSSKESSTDNFRYPFILFYFVTSIVFHKLYEFYLKVQFVITYIAPWQITWGSAFHAFAQPFSVPHSAMMFLQAGISAIFSTPLNPILGSAIFITSYVRPVKFWERDYNTKRVDHSNTRLATHLERNPGADDNNLNSIFYEHLTRSLQTSLAGDILMGRWGVVSQGDCFVLASDYLNCLVHIVEMANGLLTFQVRGLEFRGTYCQQREVEAISEGVDEDVGCCCCEPGHLPHMLSINAAFAQRWLAWEVSAIKYVLEGYSISDNSAQSILQVFDLRKVLISYYVKCIIFYVTRHAKLLEWLNNETIREALKPLEDKYFVDLDPMFNVNIDEDFDFRVSGITRASFINVYYDWIAYCSVVRQDHESFDHKKDSFLVTLCFALSLLGRRALGAASHNFLTSVEFFLYGLHALFKGDFRITSIRDEWVFCDMELLKKVVAPAVRMSVKLHQDHFMSPDEYDDIPTLYYAVQTHDEDIVISHEGDPSWRTAVLSGANSLLALRHVVDDGADEYKIIMLNKRHISFRVIKLNRECVRGLWAGQQQELIFLRNRNPERGSIQNAKQALRNIINSSCDQPIGYPIYVSPLTTSYVDTNPQVLEVMGGPLSLSVIKTTLINCWHRIWNRCGESCSTGSSLPMDCDPYAPAPPGGATSTDDNGGGYRRSDSLAPEIRGGSLPSAATGGGGRSSMSSQTSQPPPGLVLPPKLPHSSLVTLASRLVPESTSGLTGSPGLGGNKATSSGRKERYLKAKITDPFQVYDNINLGRRIDPLWPDELWRSRGGRNSWKDWIPEEGMEGTIVHKWVPCHREVLKRSHVDKTILLLKIDTRYVPIVESAVKILDPEASDDLSSSNNAGGCLMSEAVSLPPTLTTYESSDPLKVALTNNQNNNPTAGPQSLNTQILSKENDDEEMSPEGGLVTSAQGPAHGPDQGPEASKSSAQEHSSNDELAGNNASGSVDDDDDVVNPDNSTEENLAL